MQKQAPVTQDKIDIRLAELLIEARLLERTDLQYATLKAISSGLCLGNVLIMSAYITQAEYDGAAQAQSLLQNKIVDKHLLVQALSWMSQNKSSFNEALSAVSPLFPFSKTLDSHSPLLQLLQDAEIIPGAHIEAVSRTAAATGLPVERLLVSLGSLSESILESAVTAQRLHESGKIERTDAVESLKAAYQRRIPVENSIKRRGMHHTPQRPTIPLGHLLVQSGILNEEQIEQSLESGLKKRKSLGEALLEGNLVSPQILDSALRLQEMVTNETLNSGDSVSCLKSLNTSNKKLDEVVAVLEIREQEFKESVAFKDVLTATGFVHARDFAGVQLVDTADGVKHDHKEIIENAMKLVERGLIAKRTCLGALRCYFLITTGWLNLHDAVIALNYFHWKNCSFDEALQELQWTVRTHIRTEDELVRLQSIQAAESSASVNGCV